MPKCECGYEICFAKLESGKLICLDAKATIFMVRETGETKYGHPLYKADPMGNSFMVPHESVCRFLKIKKPGDKNEKNSKRFL